MTKREHSLIITLWVAVGILFVMTVFTCVKKVLRQEPKLPCNKYSDTVIGYLPARCLKEYQKADNER